MRKQLMAAAALLFCATLPLQAQKTQPQKQVKPAAPPMDMISMHCGGNMPMMQNMQGMQNMPHMQGMQNAQGMPMMEMMGPPIPAQVLHHKGDLKLTAAQVAKLEALQKQAQPECATHFSAAMASHMAANQLLNAARPDFNAYNAKMKEMANHMVEGMVVMAKAGVAARDVLTPAQQQSLKTSMQRMHNPK